MISCNALSAPHPASAPAPVRSIICNAPDASGCDGCEFGACGVGQGEFGRGNIFAQMVERGGSWNQENVRRAMQQPRQCDLHRRRAKLSRYLRKDGGLERRKSTQGKKGHIGDAECGEFVDEGVVLALGKRTSLAYLNHQ